MAGSGMLKVGLTGGIACGKSAVLREFQRLGARVVDADEIAHSVILPDQPAYRKVVEEFGSEILSPDGTIDRSRLGRLVFSDRNRLERLNSIVHPRITEEEDRLIAEYQKSPGERPPMVIVDAALMVETGSFRKYDCLIVVYCDPSVRLQRLVDRDRFSEEEALQRIESQMPLEEKVKYASYVIDNSGTLPETHRQVKEVFEALLARGEGVGK